MPNIVFNIDNQIYLSFEKTIYILRFKYSVYLWDNCQSL